MVVAIIGILAALLLPVLGSANEKARRVTCKNNLHQFHLAVQMYSSDFMDVLPSGIRDNGDQSAAFIPSTSWTSLVYYASGNQRFLVCPNMSAPNLWGTNGGLYTPGIGYSIGYFYLGGHTDTPWGSYGNYPGWISPLKMTDNNSLLLTADTDEWSTFLKWTWAAHGPRGPILLGEPFNRRGSGISVQAAGVAGCHDGYLNGAVLWKPVAQMGQYIDTGFGTSYLGAW